MLMGLLVEPTSEPIVDRTDEGVNDDGGVMPAGGVSARPGIGMAFFKGDRGGLGACESASSYIQR